MGVDRLSILDLHSGQSQGFFHNVPVDNLFADLDFVNYIETYLEEKQITKDNLAIISPDAGGVARARRVADKLGADSVVTILKRRVKAGTVDSMQLVGDVDGMDCIIMDDMIDTAGTLTKAAVMLKERGAKSLGACATHGVFSGPGIERLNECDALDFVAVTDSIPQKENEANCEKLVVVPISLLIANAIKRIHTEQSLSELFE
eukprot:TRINITY_DN5638_c0_g1_i3.p1 TRINITY_DN5638_c0_g1~~TRINITY_DN5638_c0_g1_i3.p1  ORF type:complete len:204 (-),score=67.72 TRINITY_DN5638_c0_g1_i3:277-888(-)